MNALPEKIKPPLGVMPKKLWQELGWAEAYGPATRRAELSRALREYIDGGFIGPDRWHLLIAWSEELAELQVEDSQ